MQRIVCALASRSRPDDSRVRVPGTLWTGCRLESRRLAQDGPGRSVRGGGQSSAAATVQPEATRTGMNIEILDYTESSIGDLCLRRRELLSQPGTFVTEVTVNHEFLMSSHNTLSERELSRRALAFHGGRELSVLVGGLGLGYTAYEAVASPTVARVDVVELLPQVISWLDRGLHPLADTLSGDDRVRVIQDDVFRRLTSEPAESYDVVLLDVDHSPDELLDPRNGMFYGADGLAVARRHLADRGVLAVWSSAGSEAFLRALRSVFSEACAESVTWENELIDEKQDDVVFLARR